MSEIGEPLNSDVRLTLNHYGDVLTPDMREASRKVAMLALSGSTTETDCKN